MSRLTTRHLAIAALFTALLSASAYFAVPIGAVPLTMQVFVVLLAGMMLGPRLAALSVVAYLLLGLVAPVYSGGTAGLAILFGPTGGYLFGFILAALVTGAAAGRHSASAGRRLAAALAGLVPIYALGAGWLALQLDLGPAAAVASGVVPFIWVDVLKAFAAALAAKALVSLPLDLPAASKRAH